MEYFICRENLLLESNWQRREISLRRANCARLVGQEYTQ